MTTILASIVVMLLAVAGLAVGVLMGRQPIKGSCGGMAALSSGGTCAVCGDNPAKCPDTGRDDGAAAPTVQTYDPDQRGG